MDKNTDNIIDFGTENEVFESEELEKLNDVLKKNENIKLPRALNKEEIEELLSNESLKQQKINTEIEKADKENKKFFLKFVSAVAVFAIVIVSVAFSVPFKEIFYKPQELPVDLPQENKVEDYSKIENLFAVYQENYKKYTASMKVYNTFGNLTNGVVKNEMAADTALPEAGTNAGSATGTTRVETFTISENKSESENYGETNEQVLGVNEADIIKNDGKYLYAVPNQPHEHEYYAFNEKLVEATSVAEENGVITEAVYDIAYPYNPNQKEYTEEDFVSKVYIVEPDEKGNMIIKGIVKIPNNDEDIDYTRISEIYVDGNKLVAILDCFKKIEVKNDEAKKTMYYGGYVKHFTKAVSVDITDKANPKQEWSVSQDGYYLSSRKIGDKLVLISNYNVPLDVYNDVTDYCVPDVKYGEEEFERIPVADIAVMNEVKDSSYLVASSLDVTNAKETFNSAGVLGGGQNIYCSQDNLYITNGEYADFSLTAYEDSAVAEVFRIPQEAAFKTGIFKFSISGEQIEYVANGTVDGRILNQFSIDEYNNHLRIATTEENLGISEESNSLFILDEKLNEVGKLTGIAKGEEIKSVRFSGETGYVVTFEQTDPLFVIDLKNPEKPKVLGELKIPGFSAYLHPVSENLVLGVGVSGDENGQTDGLKVSLFDVSDKENPKEVDKFEILPVSDSNNNGCYIDSEAFNTHKALCFDNKNSLVYIPYSVNIYNYNSSERFLSVLAIKIDIENKKLIKENVYETAGEENFRDMFNRVTYIGENVYAYSYQTNDIYSFNKEDGKSVNNLELK